MPTKDKDTKDEWEITDVTTTNGSALRAAFGGSPEHVYNVEHKSTGERGITTGHDRKELYEKLEQGKYKRKN